MSTSESLSPAARRYLRAWALSGPLADTPAHDPRRMRMATMTPPSTANESALEVHFVSALTYGQAAREANSEAAAEQLWRLGAPHLRALDAAGERAPAREAIAVIESAERVSAFFHTLAGALQ